MLYVLGFLRITGRHRLDCTHQRKSHVLRILVYHASGNGVMFCNSIMNEILNKCSKIKMIILNENFIMKFTVLQVGIRALV